MPDILHRVGIDAQPEQVFKALTTLDGVRSWWTSTADGSAAEGGVTHYGFCDMHVLAAKPNQLVHWRCTAGPEAWIGTEVSYRLERKEGQTYVLFKHANWKEASEFMHHCSTKWATFLLSLKDLLERSEGRPLPNDLKIEVGEGMRN